MEIVLIHGYFLKGTGSNLFVRNVCGELCKQGHNISLFCQEDHPDDIDFVTEAYAFDSANTSAQLIHKKETKYPGKCSLYRPNLNGFLPVYVYDEYEGYAVKELKHCNKKETEQYIDCNVKALDTLAEKLKPDLIWSNHTVMQPVYAERSKLRCLAKKHIMTVHGSCLNFAVRESKLMQKYAWEGIRGADEIAFVSEHSKNEFMEFFRHYPSIEKKSLVISGGVDLAQFVPLSENQTKKQRIEGLIEDLVNEKEKNMAVSKKEESSWQTDENIIEKLRLINFEEEKMILYYGKYLWTKGIQVLLAAMPLLLQCQNNVRIVLVGYGAFREYLEAMADALEEGREGEFIELLKQPERFHAMLDPAAATYCKSLVLRLEHDITFKEEYFRAAKGKIRSALTFTGFLGHEHLNSLIACADITVAPSVFPEAFGLVGLEALASGIIPVQTNHSGFAEVIRKYVDEFSDVWDKKKMHPLYLDEALVFHLADNLCSLLNRYSQMDSAERHEIRQRARKISEDYYSWESVVNRYLL